MKNIVKMTPRDCVIGPIRVVGTNTNFKIRPNVNER